MLILSGLLVLIILEILLKSYYSTIILISITIVSYSVSIVTLGLLSQRLVSWFKSSKSFGVLLYALASTAFVISAILSIMFVSYTMFRISDVIEPHGHNLLYFSNPGSVTFFLYNGYVIFSVLSFILTWIATAVVLHHYSKRIGNVKYWALVSLPLIYFLAQFFSLFLNLFSPLLEQSPVLFGVLLSVIFPLSKTAGGILFGIAFWTLAGVIKKPDILKDSMAITAIGFVLLYASDQSVSLIVAPYPPFGLASVSTVGLASYLIFAGLYSASISVSVDVKLRQSIKKTAMEQSKFLDTIGTAHMSQEVEKKVLRIAKANLENIEKQSGMESSLTDDDIKQYLVEVFSEIKSTKN